MIQPLNLNIRVLSAAFAPEINDDPGLCMSDQECL